MRWIEVNENEKIPSIVLKQLILLNRVSNLFRFEAEIYRFSFSICLEAASANRENEQSMWNEAHGFTLLTNINKNIINCGVLHKNKERKDWWTR